LNTHETNKLFYGQYLYKIQLRNSLASYFREKNLPLARQALDTLRRLDENDEPLLLGKGLRLYQVSDRDYNDAKKLYALFSNFEDYKLRVEQMTLNVYGNNRLWILNVAASISKANIIEFWEPNTNYLSLLQKDTILISEDNGYQYKVTFGNNKGESNFARWAIANPKQVKIGPVCMRELQANGYVSGMYFYARDEKTLQLCSLMTTNIRRIDKLIVKADI
jgi:hypothetical protein|tara:strand:- start:359 stop:1021 length:663 start_codon:yes stop_codon:yes gene_type:complete